MGVGGARAGRTDRRMVAVGMVLSMLGTVEVEEEKGEVLLTQHSMECDALDLEGLTGCLLSGSDR